jgi:hypothetical protein
VPDLERVQQNTPLTLSQQWYEGGTAVDPGTVTIGIVRADGTELVAPATATSGAGTAARAYNLTTAHTALLDRLTVTWTSTLKGTLTSYVEVVGGFLFGLSELSGKLTDSTSSYTAAQLADARTYAETYLESKIGHALVPRFGTYRGDGDGTAVFRLPVTYLRSVRWVNTYSLGVATAYSAGELLAIEPGPGVVYGSYWPRGYYNVALGFEHGRDFPPPEAKEAALILAEQYIVQGPIDDRATQRSSEFGSVNLSTPGMFGSISGIGFVDECIRSNRIPAVA